MSDSDVGDVVRALLRSPQARAVWMRQGERRSRADINRAAVARAVARAHDEPVSGRRPGKDRVTDAINGVLVSQETLRRLAKAFSWPGETLARLIELRDLHGSAAEAAAERLLTNAETIATAAGPRPYETLQLVEVHRVGPNRLPVSHTTIQTVRAVVDSLPTIRYAYMRDESHAVVTVRSGGRVVHTSTVNEIVVHDIELPEPLRCGHTAGLTYDTEFYYSTPPEAAFRRGMSAQVRSIDIQVAFDPTSLPKRIYDTRWETSDGPWITRDRVRLNAAGVAQMYVDDRTTDFIGFSWDW